MTFGTLTLKRFKGEEQLMYTMSSFDRILGIALVVLTGFCCVSDYVSGRFAFALMLEGTVIKLLLFYIIAPLFAIGCLSTAYAGRRLKQFGTRILFIVAVFALGMVPSWFGYGVTGGLSNHIKRVFTAAVIAELRALAERKILENPDQKNFELAAAELPPRIGASPWGFPNYIYVTSGKNPNNTTVTLTWSSHIISHGIVLSDVPLRNEDPDHRWEMSLPIYTPWIDNSYIFMQPD